MTTEVWVEWQAKMEYDPFGEQRADLRNAMLIEHIYKAAFQAVGRVVGIFADNGDQYDYTTLPNYGTFMPYLTKEQREKIMSAGVERYDTPLDPNEMTEEQFEAMYDDLGTWQAFLGGVDPSVRIVRIAEVG